jgi:hypothetical protein
MRAERREKETGNQTPPAGEMRAERRDEKQPGNQTPPADDARRTARGGDGQSDAARRRCG